MFYGNTITVLHRAIRVKIVSKHVTEKVTYNTVYSYTNNNLNAYINIMYKLNYSILTRYLLHTVIRQ